MRRRIVISGRVQGVFFRDSVRARAEALGLAGWVRNRDDGTVEAVFEGNGDAVAAALSWCETGPPRARVDGVVVGDDASEEELRGFTVR
jgi:acylphosphatase